MGALEQSGAWKKILERGRREVERNIGYQGLESVTANKVMDSRDKYLERATTLSRSTLFTGYKVLDQALHGIIPGHVAFLCSRPGVGKTSFLLSVIRNQCRQGKKILFFSLEMSEMELFERCCQMSNGIGIWEVLNRAREGGSLYDNMLVKVEEDYNSMWIVDEGGITPKNICNITEIYEAYLQIRFDAIVIDYFNLLKADGRVFSTYDKASEIARALQTLSKDIDKPILCAAQLHRGKSGMEMPSMDDLRDSGVIEEVGAVIMGLWRPTEDQLCLTVLKNKRGGTIKVEMDFHQQSMKIGEDRRMFDANGKR
jgi:replicative DNA helicase